MTRIGTWVCKLTGMQAAKHASMQDGDRREIIITRVKLNNTEVGSSAIYALCKALQEVDKNIKICRTRKRRENENTKIL